MRHCVQRMGEVLAGHWGRGALCRGRGCPVGAECRVFPLLQREAPQRCLGSLVVILAVPLSLDRACSCVLVWWQ